MATVPTRKEMKRQFRQYCESAHPANKHVKAALAAIDELWRNSRRSRRSREDAWEALSALGKGKEDDPITATNVKKAFRDHITPLQQERCCYCRQWLFRMAHAKPIEHVLPRQAYPHYALHFWNLAVACADCNRLKGKTVWGNFAKDRYFYPAPHEYTDIFHPRFHQYDEHVQFAHLATNRGSISVYKGLTPQGRHLCAALLHKVAAERMLLEANPELNSAISDIETFRSETPGKTRLTEFMDALDASLLKLVSSPQG